MTDPFLEPDSSDEVIPRELLAEEGPIPSLEHPLMALSLDEEVNPPDLNTTVTIALPSLENTHCPQCRAERQPKATYCFECGYIFPLETTPPSNEFKMGGRIVGSRYQIGELMGERSGVVRFRGMDISTGNEEGVPVVILREPLPIPAPIPEKGDPKYPADSAPDFDVPTPENEEQPTEVLLDAPEEIPMWPSVAWERGVLVQSTHLSLPRLLDAFTEDGFAYLVEEVPVGISLWDAWEARPITWKERIGWLIQLAEALNRLHHSGAMLESLRPEMIVLTPSGQAVIADLTDLLPLPLRGEVPLRGGFYTAPELILAPHLADGRADLYTFGAMVHALLMGRELTELDFTLNGLPRPYIERFPDFHPSLGRVLAKTFCRDIDRRFPTDDGLASDPTGFQELMQALEACQRNMDRVHLDISAWTTTGIVRSGNEDAVAILHSSEARLDDADEFAIILLADGMGGMESGEVAAALAIQSLRQTLLHNPPFTGFLARGSSALRGPAAERLLGVPVAPGGEDPHATDPNRTTHIFPTKFSTAGLMVRPSDRDTPSRGPHSHQDRIVEALREANRQVYDAAKHGLAHRGMGCTAEVILIDGSTVVIGHVGDSRVYHMRQGRLTLITRDQTLVARLVELGHLTPEEAETHPRRAELQQAIGGRSEVYPETYFLTLQPGDWLMVCSDGLSNQLPREIMEAVLRDSTTAEKAARRLVNVANLEGAADNATVVVVHAS